ncbi:MAG: hypothetical protein E7081_05970 [Bacteroidales bacterium]|nr:hypothetical protein [Bacteroidales bacterium]
MAKNLLRFIIPIIALFAITCGINKSESVITEQEITDNLTIQIDTSYTEPATLNFDLLFPRQISSTNLLRIQNSTNRTNNANKKNFKYFNFIRVEYLGIKNIFNEKQLIIHSSFIKPFHRLICLGKLVI